MTASVSDKQQSKLQFFEKSLWILTACLLLLWLVPTPVWLSVPAVLIGGLFFSIHFTLARYLLTRLFFNTQKRGFFAFLYVLKLLFIFAFLGLCILHFHLSVVCLALGFLVFPGAILLLLIKEAY